MDLYNDDFSSFNAPPAIEINIRPNILYTEEYSYLTRDELEVLFLLATTEMTAEGLTSFSFSGLKRQLGKHQQKITKAVNRLLSKGLISKKDTGYSISPKGTNVLSEIIKVQNAVDLNQSNETYLQQRITFNKQVPLDELTSMLIGKWFGSFRYISHTEGKNLIIRWQLVDNRASATLNLDNYGAVLTIIPDNKDFQHYIYEQALDDLSQYIITLINSFGIQSTIDFEGWGKSSISKIQYQQQFITWLDTFNS
jgi:DNA-binding MarR family transcriptional regulator